MVAPNVPRKGELRGSTQPSCTKMPKDNEPKDGDPSKGNESGILCTSSKRKRSERDDHPLDLDAPWKTRGKCIDYCHLNDPFSDKEGEGDDLVELALLATNAKTQIGGNEPSCLAEAKRSPEWPEWEHAIQEELAQLKRKGTWRLANTPTNAVPIANRWVFTKKYNKFGDLLKYKGRLVVKGCAQCPGYDYVDTFAPVVRLETLHAILSMAVTKDLQIKQMDVKGTYLNGVLKETVYMKQPEGYTDGTERMCLLVKNIVWLETGWT